MRSKNLTARDLEHMGRVKSLPCSVCDAPAPTEAHHVRQGLHYTTVALCAECHRGTHGWHGDKVSWRVRKMDELDALDITQQRLERYA